MPLGSRNSEVNPFADTDFHETAERKQRGMYVTECIRLFRKDKREVIRLGKGVYGNLKFFFQFDGSKYIKIDKRLAISGESLQSKHPFRVYIKVTPAEEYQIGCVNTMLVGDTEFVSNHNGKFYDAGAIGVSLHACHRGVFVYYNESGGDFGTDSVHSGHTYSRRNSFLD